MPNGTIEMNRMGLNQQGSVFRRTCLGLALVLLAGAVYLKAGTHPGLGIWLMQTGGQLEARIHGFEEKTVMAGGIAHRIYEGGSPANPTIVMLHGYSADKDVWPRFAAHLVDSYHIVIPDMAGHGETGFNTDWAYDMPSQAARIVALMDELDVGQFHVTGNSMGGFVTATIAANFPERVLSAAPIDPAGVRSPQASPMEKMLAAGRNPFEVQSRAEFAEFYAMTMAKPPYLPKVILDGMAQTYQDRREELAHIHRGFAGKDMLDMRLSEIKAPMLLMWGKKDQLLDVSAVKVWQAGVPNIEVLVFDDLGHMPMVENPKASAQAYLDFLIAVKGLRL